MSRSVDRRRVGLFPWLIAAAVIAASVFVLFRYVDPERLTGQWPLGIGAEEVDAYASVLEVRDDTASGQAERYLISSAPGACIIEERGTGWSRHWFEADGYGDSAQVRRSRAERGGLVIKYKRGNPFRSQRHVVLTPASVHSLRAKYLEVLADELGLISPEVSFVRLIACGLDQGLHMKEERIDGDFLEKRGLAGATLASQGHAAGRPDHLFPDFEDSLAYSAVTPVLARAYADAAAGNSGAMPFVIDARAAAALIILAWLEHGPAAFGQEHMLAHDWSRGRLVPLYRRSRAGEAAEAPSVFRMRDALTSALADDQVRREVRERWLRLSEDAWRVRERFAAIDRAWLPVLCERKSLAQMRARMRRVQEELIGDRALAADPVAGLQAELTRYAGAASHNAGMHATGYWPGHDDAGILAGIAQRTKAYVRGDTLVFPRGRFTIGSDLTIPYGHAVVMEAGARLEIAAGASVMVQGPLHMRGTRRNPVFIRAADDRAPFGSFAVVGDGTIDVRIEGLQLSGGSEGWINAVRASGMLAIHGAARTSMSDCVISGSHGEDLVNIMGGDVLLRDCAFEDGHADLVDLDRCTGHVERCSFRNARGDANGDGLDVSASRILVTASAFTGMNDKGISVGEASQLLVIDSRFEGNASALVAKDLSIAYASNNAFTGNKVAFAAYRKKSIYGGARVVRYANTLLANVQEQQADEHSAIMLEALMDEKVRRMFGLP